MGRVGDINTKYTVGNADRTDANAFTVPGDEDGGEGDDSFALESDAVENYRYGWYIHAENGWDVNVDVQVRGSRFDDGAMTAAATDGTAETANSGGGVVAIDGETKHSFVDVEIDPAGTPTSGDLVVTFQRRRE